MAGTRPAMTGGGVGFLENNSERYKSPDFFLDKIRNISYEFLLSEFVSRSGPAGREEAAAV